MLDDFGIVPVLFALGTATAVAEPLALVCNKTEQDQYDIECRIDLEAKKSCIAIPPGA